MRSVDLAWTLAASVKDHLDTAERNLIYVALGSGDTYSAIRRLISVAVRGRVPLPQNLIDALQEWNSAHDDRTTKLSAVIWSIPIQSEPRAVDSPQKAEYLAVIRDYRR